ncbi:baseplate J/gp47 family protein [Actinopolymorpha pittospori]
MIDPGNPFLVGHDFPSVVAALEDGLHLGVEQQESYRFVFDPAVLVYDLPRESASVVRVTGLSGGHFTIFEAGRDYDAGSSRVVWRKAGGEAATPAHRPDPRTPVEVTYTYRDLPSGITDFAPGSVAGTIVRAVGREVALLYHQMNEAYRRGFLDTANGVALDSVVALLGIVRNPAQKATGTVLFTRRQPGPRVIVPVGTAVEDPAGRRFLTTTAALLDEGTTEGEAAVEASEPGVAGNVGANAVTVMPTPPGGVDSVTNPAPITGGQEPEPDDALRERARHALERAGNATMGAMEFAVRDVDGVEDVAVIDHSVDLDVPLGQVRVRYSVAAGSEERQAEIDDAVAAVVDRTRAAGVMAVPERVRLVTITGQFVLLPSEIEDLSAATTYVDTATQAIRTLAIGEALSLRRLTSLVYQVPGLADVAEAQLNFARESARPGLPTSGEVGDLVSVHRSEQAAPGALTALVVDGIGAAAAPGPGKLSIRLLRGTTPVGFRQVTLQVRLQVKTGLVSTPSLPPVVIGDVVKPVVLTGNSSGTATITSADLTGFRSGEHSRDAEVTVTLAGYPGVAAAPTPLNLTGVV